MNVSGISIKLSSQDIMSIVHDFVKVKGLEIKEFKIKDTIEVSGSFKAVLKIPFYASLAIGSSDDGIIILRILKVKIARIGIPNFVKNMALKQAKDSVKDFGVKIYKEEISIDISKILEKVPMVDLDIDSIEYGNNYIELKVKNIEYNANKVIEEKTQNKLVPYSNKVNDNYSTIRESINKKIPNKYAKLSDYILLFPDLLILMFRLFKDKRVPIKTKVIVGAVIIYMVSPVDVIPSFIPFAGKIDDVAIAIFALNMLINDLPEEIIIDNWSGKDDIILSIRNGANFFYGFLGADNIKIIVKNLESLYSRNRKNTIDSKKLIENKIVSSKEETIKTS